MSKREYQKLCASRGGMGRYTLWMGADHLLSLHSGSFTENYKRFYFRDITGVIVRPTASWMVRGAVLLALTALSALGSYFATRDNAAVAAMWGFPALFLILSGWVFARGATCEFYLVSAVQQEKVKAVQRMRQASKAMEKLLPCILEAQAPAADAKE